MTEEFLRGEEGIDYQVVSKNKVDPNIPNEKMLMKQIKEEIKMMKLKNPEDA